MLGFFAGLLVPYLALCVWGFVDSEWWLRGDRQTQVAFITTIFLIPAGSALATAEVLNLVRPRKMFDGRMRRQGKRRIALGLCAGVIGALATAAALPMLENVVSDSLVTGAAAALGALICVLPLPKIRPGFCIHCGYDLRAGPAPGQPGAGVCPECGVGVMA